MTAKKGCVKHDVSKKAQPASSDKVEACEIFVDVEALKKYNTEVLKKDSHLEKGLALSSEPHYGLKEEVTEVIDLHKWKKFGAHLKGFCLPLAREFYAILG